MRRLDDASWWVLALVTGVPFGLVMGVVGALGSRSVYGALTGAVVGGVLFGAIMSVVLRRMQRRVPASYTAAPDDLRRVATRAVRGGPVPQDPAVRAATLDLARFRLAELEGQRWWSAAVFVLGAVGTAALALTRSPWWWLGTLEFVFFLVLAVRQRRQLRRRVVELAG